MMLRSLLLTLVIALLIVPTAAQPVEAVVSITTAMETAMERFEGRVIAADFMQGSAGQPSALYSLRLLTPNGDIVQVIIDAADGRIVEANGRGLVDARKRPRVL